MADVKAVKKTNKVADYLRGVKTELKKVVWPTKKETIRYTEVVLLVCAFFALFFWLLDTGFLALLELALGITL